MKPTKLLTFLNSIQNKFTSHILLYHSTYSDVPKNLEKNIHNVTPEIMYKQIKWIKKYFDVVEVDELFKEGTDISGKAAITFDDAYQSVLSAALPLLESLNTPCTIFVNGISLTNKPFWRDKVRFIINQSLIDDFLAFCSYFAKTNNISNKNFYGMTKHVNVNSAELDYLLDNFFQERQIRMDEICYCVNNEKKLIDHPLISYGNHSYNHYVLSTLSEEEQDREIGKNHNMLKKLNLKLSKIFSIPFGEDKDFNLNTVKIIKKYGYHGFLYSRKAINLNWNIQNAKINGLKYRDRYMLPSSFASFQNLLFTMYKLCFTKM